MNKDRPKPGLRVSHNELSTKGLGVNVSSTICTLFCFRMSIFQSNNDKWHQNLLHLVLMTSGLIWIPELKAFLSHLSNPQALTSRKTAQDSF